MLRRCGPKPPRGIERRSPVKRPVADQPAPVLDPAVIERTDPAGLDPRTANRAGCYFRAAELSVRPPRQTERF